MRDDPIMRLAAANPVPHDGSLYAPEAQGHGLRRRRLALGLVVAAGVVAVVLVATPAWGLVRDVLPFWGQPSAPHSVQVDFSSAFDGGVPRLSPQADAANAREIMQAEFGGATHTLYVAPAKNDRVFRYCFDWSHVIAGCPRVHQDPHRPDPMDVLQWNVLPHDAGQVPQPVPFEVRKGHAYVPYGVPEWLTFDTWSQTGIASVVVHFSDGTTVQPEITWVSAPINAGFFAYQVPNDKQSASDHVTEVDGYDANGNLVEQLPMGTRPRR